MAHFAKLDDSNIVVQVIVVSNRDCLDGNGDESEAVGIAFCKKMFGNDTTWVQTSYNNKIRAQYAGLGFKYDATHDIFHPVDKPIDENGDVCNSYTLNTTTGGWEAPLSDPDYWTPSNKTGGEYYWDESLYQSDNTKGWVERKPIAAYASWTIQSFILDGEEVGLLQAPIDYPDDGKNYVWDESVYQGDNTKGWVEA